MSQTDPDARKLAEDKRRTLGETTKTAPFWAWPSAPSRRVMSSQAFWETGFEAPMMWLSSAGLAGDFAIRGYWRFWDDPVDGGGLFRESSVSVNVSAHGMPDLPDSFCVARYDVECHGEGRGRHLNVFQPVIGDRAHWVVPGPDNLADWPTAELLSWIVESVADELDSAGWPKV